MRVIRSPPHVLGALLLIGVELVIALCVVNPLIRGHGGDLLCVVLLYTLARGFTQISPRRACLVSFALACAVELGQHHGLVSWLGLEHSRFWSTLLGTHFDAYDLLAYALGAATVLLGQAFRGSRTFGVSGR